MSQRPAITNNVAEHRFETGTAHGTAMLRYVQRGNVIDLMHTVVPQAAEGNGVGSALAHAALEHARAKGLKVIPSCAFVHRYVTKHREFADLIVQPAAD